MLNIQFYFEAVVKNLGGFTAANPLNINDATYDQLILIGLSEAEATDTILEGSYAPFSSVTDWATELCVSSVIDRYQEYEDAGILIFE